jgi:probable addiction module antidote protein
MTMNHKTQDYNTSLYERLQDDQYALAYLKEGIADEDSRVFLMAVKDVIEAKKITMTELASRCNINRVTLHKMLSSKGNPGFSNIANVLENLGFHFDVSVKQSQSKKIPAIKKTGITIQKSASRRAGTTPEIVVQKSRKSTQNKSSA